MAPTCGRAASRSASSRCIKPRSASTLEEYAALFAGATDRHLAVGKSSPTYMMSPEVAPRIKARLPEVKLVAILRQPVDQALSLYMVRQGGSVAGAGLTEAFVEALTTESAGSNGARDGLAIVEYGLYHRYLAAFYQHFDRRQIKVALLEELQRDSGRFFAELFRFLGVDEGFRPELSATTRPALPAAPRCTACSTATIGSRPGCATTCRSRPPIA